MLFRLAAAVCCLIVTTISSPIQDRKRPQLISLVNLGYAQYQGTLLSLGITQYLGMRYASPPLGDLRFRAPQPPQSLSGVQNAQTFQPICLATNNGPTSSQSEDCLFVNVWAPSTATSASKLPVWVFIQGGGYISNSNANFNGSTVVNTSNRGIVFVNFNYRVGPFGFLTSEKVRQNGHLNTGLLDQRLLLQWVQNHIAQFGGDPNHVVIHGDSAGAGSVALHLTAYGGRNDGLFIGGIGESPFFPTQPQVSELEWQFDRYANSAGCGSAGDVLGCLRSQSTAVLQAANIASPYPGQVASPLFYWTPTIDGDFIQDYPYVLFEKGLFVHVPIMFGDTYPLMLSTDVTEEGSVFAPNAASPNDIATFFKNNYPLLTSTDTTAINTQYPLTSPLPNHAPYFPSVSTAYGETTFTCPAITISIALATHNDPSQVWSYRYNVLDTNNLAQGLGVPHVFELPAIFGPGNANDGPSSYTSYNANIVPVVMKYWISFVKFLSPNQGKDQSAPHWESLGSLSAAGGTLRRLLLQTNGSMVEIIPDEQLARCSFWKGLAGRMEQ
ncbi:hypothetical protein SBOR_8556 [Sclerotinia borealis F-4128]|uniref:Carboxylic ester hydrolase n=1 Tax=Sclerotinia borealis (strain F-4128) TaxID=1432307 RepID=W9C2P6_SCLBF|nr:hypothetical protein SBOR_8556 [Sclerotinia borealis F-4128]